ncbi:uncharacterized protein PGTG_11563 [Puccinia graminis f. sp. tritici CRL 75-36-700-3]|uniref:Uncharacterized protein n=1 Tax=Puccinia graminis f. sp. tritici (strain CRL 75-36-700-3 / race SCCL) TaxID=418459 RepID=E3KM45_PUCGT|nr:uncharacterized protein PGTG_11563 [Puccinia graminis f. sp. tritici CRL 75-36-700-3]EFP85394.2 hypothetical protein PGTG_11563 [Puccinia graminis f. sp. tritici CRL 75-36-700-3]
MEDMEGYEKKDWAELKKEMLEKWGQSEQRYWEADLDRLVEEMAEKGGIQMPEQYGKYVLSFDRILKYLNWNKMVTNTLEAEMRDEAVCQLFERNLVKRLKDGSVIVLPEMKEILKALLCEMDMHWDRFGQKLPLRRWRWWQGPLTCSYCGVLGHFKAQWKELTTDIKTSGVCPVIRDYYLDGKKIEAAVPGDKVCKRRSTKPSATAKGKEAVSVGDAKSWSLLATPGAN